MANKITVKRGPKPTPVAYLHTASGAVYIPKSAEDGGGMWWPKGKFYPCSYTPDLLENNSRYEPLYPGTTLEIAQDVKVITL